MDEQIIRPINEQIDELFEGNSITTVKAIGLGDLLVKRMREALEMVIESALKPFLPMLNEYETLEGDDE